MKQALNLVWLNIGKLFSRHYLNNFERFDTIYLIIRLNSILRGKVKFNIKPHSRTSKKILQASCILLFFLLYYYCTSFLECVFFFVINFATNLNSCYGIRNSDHHYIIFIFIFIILILTLNQLCYASVIL